MFVLLPLGLEDDRKEFPTVVFSLIGLNVLGFTAQCLSNDQLVNLALDADSTNTFQFLTHMFLHGDIFHILGNMIYLYAFGVALNKLMGHTKFVMFYLATGFLAGLTWLLTSDYGYALGASGAISGLIGGALALFPFRDIRCAYLFIFIPYIRKGIIGIAAIWLCGFYFLQNVFWWWLTGDQGVAYSAHVGGLVAGFVVAIIMRKAGWVEKDRDDIVSLVTGQKEFEQEKKARLQSRHELRQAVDNLPLMIRAGQLQQAANIMVRAIKELSKINFDRRSQEAVIQELKRCGQYEDMVLVGRHYFDHHGNNPRAPLMALLIGWASLEKTMDLDLAHKMLQRAWQGLRNTRFAKQNKQLLERCTALQQKRSQINSQA